MPRLYSLYTLLILLGFSVSGIAQPAPPPVDEPAARTTNITLEEIWQEYKFFADGVPGFNFRKRGNFYSRVDEAKVVEVDFATGETTSTLFDYGAARMASDTSLPASFDDYAFSDDQRGILLSTGTEPIYRRSSRSAYYLADSATGRITALDTTGKQSYATFSPDGKHVAYVRNRNLYIYHLDDASVTQVTDDGADNTVINGATDWVYEEEFGFAKAFEWSPDSKSILFLRFDETAVPEFTMEMYNADELYPEYRTWKYPKVGEANATVSAHVFEAASGETRLLFDSRNGDTHVPRIYFTPDAQPVVWTSNRLQDTFHLLVERTPGAPLTTLLTETSDTYLDVHDDLRFMDDGSFLWTSDRSGYNHLYLYAKDGTLLRQLTRGNYPVTEFYGFDASAKTLYYQAAMTSPMRREVYRLSLNAGQPQQISTQPGWNSAVFNGDYSGYMLSHSTANQPPTYAVYEASTGTLVRSLVDNAEMAATQKEEGVRPVEFFSFDNGQGTELNGWMITPEGFDADVAADYPVFMYVYGGPGSQQVVDSWSGSNYWWFQMLAQEGYIVACVDNRGTGARGAEFQKQTYLELGKLELEDQIAAAKYLGSQPYVDANRIGIFGWSYGGYMTSLCATKASDVFSMAIAVAPVTNWKWYDTLYTERYMRTLKNNADGYYDNSPVNFAEGMEADYLLVHGMGDDNVHFQHSVEMVDALVAANKDFEFYAYPNRNHGIYGGITRFHLYERMTEFVRERL